MWMVEGILNTESFNWIIFTQLFCNFFFGFDLDDIINNVEFIRVVVKKIVKQLPNGISAIKSIGVFLKYAL